MKILIYLSFILSLFCLQSCQSAKDALEGKTRSQSSDEFLVEKKNPLSMPPDYQDLPIPNEINQTTNTTQDEDLKKKLKIKTSKNNTQSEITSLEQKILNEIQE